MSPPTVRDADQLWALRALRAAGDRPLTMSEIKDTAKSLRIAAGEVVVSRLKVTDLVMDDLAVIGVADKWVDGRRVSALSSTGRSSRGVAYSITTVGLAVLDKADGNGHRAGGIARVQALLKHGRHYAAAQLRMSGEATTWKEAWEIVDAAAARSRARNGASD
jgi:hypothetical protein